MRSTLRIEVLTRRTRGPRSSGSRDRETGLQGIADPGMRRGAGDEGNAVVEFLGVALILLLPVMYLALTLGRIQAATFAVEGAAKGAGRAFVTADSVEAGEVRAGVAVSLALADQGFEDVALSEVLSIACTGTPCLAPGAEVVTVVRYDVPLPFVPPGVRGWIPLSVPVEAVHVAPVDQYAAARP